MGKSLKEKLAIIRARAMHIRNREEAPELLDDLIESGAVGRGPDAVTDKPARPPRRPAVVDSYEQYKSGEPGPIETIEPGEERDHGGDPFYLVLATGQSVDPAAPDEQLMWARHREWPRFIEPRMYSQLPSPRKRPADGWQPPLFDGESVCFLDIETTGLSPTTYLFLIGLMYFRDGQFVMEQVFARNYAEEAAVVKYVRERLGRFESLVTYNGASFDIPFIETRLAALRGLPLQPIASVDLLYTARKVYRGVLPNCRLGTVERHIRGIDRTGDIPGAQIPGAYHEYVRTGDARAMKNVLYHNRMDLFTMAMLINRL